MYLNIHTYSCILSWIHLHVVIPDDETDVQTQPTGDHAIQIAS